MSDCVVAPVLNAAIYHKPFQGTGQAIDEEADELA